MGIIRDDKVCIEVITLEDAVSTDVKTLVERQEIVILLVYVDLGIVLREAGKHLLDRCRLLGLIDVAEQGKFKSRMFHNHRFCLQR